MAMIVSTLFLAIPLMTLIFFVVSLCEYLSARKREKREPGSVSPEEMKRRKTMLIVSSVIAGVLLAIVVGFVGLLYMAVAFM